MRLRLRHFLLAPRSGELPALVTFCFAALAGLYDLALRRMGIPSDQITGQITQPLLFVMLGCAAFYGAMRASTCHPITALRYLKWLATTPWRPPMALPLDPIHPVWQDAVQWAILTVLGVLLGHSPSLPGIALLGGYLLALCLALFHTGQRRVVAVIIAILPVNWYLRGRWALVLMVVAAMCLLALYGVHRSWRTFPWGVHERLAKLRARGNSTQKYLSSAQMLGWPYDRLNAYDPPRRFDRRTVLACALIAGWYVFSFCQCVPWPECRDAQRLAGPIAGLGCLVAGGRFLAYFGGHLPPMSLLARVVRGNLILPGYDRMLAAPLAVGLTAVLGPAVFRAMAAYPPLTAGLMTTIELTMAFCLPPTLRHWQLTGQYRMVVVGPRVSKGR